MLHIKDWRKIVATIACLFIGFCLHGRTADTTQHPIAVDSIKPGFVAKMQEFAQSSAKSSAAELALEKAALEQKQVLEAAGSTIQKAKAYLKTGIDTFGNRSMLEEIKQNLAIAEDGVFVNKGTAQTFRNLTATANILNELLGKANARKVRLDDYYKELKHFGYKTDSILSIRVLFNFPTDSLPLAQYLDEIRSLAKETKPVRTLLKATTANIEASLKQANQLVFLIQNDLDEIELYQRQMADHVFAREFNNLWEPRSYSRPFAELLSYSVRKGILTFRFYLVDNAGKLFAMFLLIAGCSIYLRSLKKIYTENGLIRQDLDGQLVIRYPVLSAVLIVTSLFQFAFLHLPFIISVGFWTISCIALTIIFSDFISRYWLKVWLAMMLLFLIAAIDNLILQASRPERWLMSATAFIGMVAGTIALVKGRKKELKEHWIKYSILLMVVAELGAAIANLFGRYNLSKTLLISGFINVVVGILFLWTIRLINEGMSLAFTVYKKPDRKLFYINSQRVGKKTPPLFYVLLVVGWGVLVGRNSPLYERLIRPLKGFFTKERTLGEYSFSINNLLLFVAIMAIAMIVSKVVSFFASDRHLASDKDERQGIGSWILLVRISILSIGLFLAVAAAGIPLEKITIVLGALGVGIGFGLQTLVNNLVSGLIIAFEKPVNVGDLVDIDGKSGTMKSIGFRSSVIATSEGADLVMPNGQLLDAHLINWSLGGNKRRQTILVGVAYNADLEQAKALLQKILDKDERIMKHPQATVQFEQFGASAIDLRAYFWTGHMKDANQTRSDLIIQVNKAFLEAGIGIPVPQQEIYLHQAPGENPITST